MLDVQRERLRHLVANAILELWKKETGTLSPVIIEGTICITSGNGRTTVVQVSNQFSGTIPEGTNNDDSSTYSTPKRKMVSLRNSHPLQHINAHHRNALMASYFEELSRPSLKTISSNETAQSYYDNTNKPQNHDTVKKNRSQNSSNSDQSMDISSIKDEIDHSDVVDDEEEEEDNSDIDVTNTSHTGPVIAGTGEYVQDEENNNKILIHETNDKENETDAVTPNKNSEGRIECFDSSIGFSPRKSDNVPLISTPKEKRDSDETATSHVSEVPTALDLTSPRVSKEQDLALSSPHNYTAQVRDVIRQRLLANRQSTESRDGHSSQNGDEDSPSPSVLEYSPMPPLMNLNLTSPAIYPLPGYHPGFSRSMPPSPGFLGHPHMGGGSMYPPSQAPDMFSSPGRPLSSPPVRPPSSPYDQNGNEKDSTNEKGEPQKTYRCSYCSKTFLFKSKYYEHLPVHTNVRPFQCHLCSRTYKYKYDLRVHLRTHMGIPTKSTVCPFCSTKFNTNKLLRLHIQEMHHSQASKLEPVELHLQDIQQSLAAKIEPVEVLTPHSQEQPAEPPVSPATV